MIRKPAHRLVTFVAASAAAVLMTAGLASAEPFEIDTDWVFVTAQAEEAPEVDVTAQATASAKDVVDGLQKFYNDSDSFKADFIQVYEQVGMKERESKGTVYFKKAGKMRWDYQASGKNGEKFLFSDGDTFYAWEPGYNQYCKQKLDDVAMPSALTFLTGQGKITDDFDVELLDGDDDFYQVGLTPKSPNPNYESLEFTVRRDNFRVEQVVIVDATGNVNRLYFKKQKLNETINDDTFQWTPPSDATHMCK